MKIFKKAVTSGTRSPIMSNNQTVSVKVFLSYPKPTKKRKRKSSMKRVPSRNLYSPLQTKSANVPKDEVLTDEDSPNMDSLFDSEEPFTTTTPTTSSDYDSSFPTSFTTKQSPNKTQETENEDWGNFSSGDGGGSDLDLNTPMDPLLTQGENTTYTKGQHMKPSEFSGPVDQSTSSISTLSTRFHTEKQIGVPITESSFPIMQMNISTIDECSYYILLHRVDIKHKVTVCLEISPDGENFVRQEEKELYPKEMLVLSPHHVAHFTRLYIMDHKRGPEEEIPSAQLDIYFQYRSSIPL